MVTGPYGPLLGTIFREDRWIKNKMQSCFLCLVSLKHAKPGPTYIRTVVVNIFPLDLTEMIADGSRGRNCFKMRRNDWLTDILSNVQPISSMGTPGPGVARRAGVDNYQPVARCHHFSYLLQTVFNAEDKAANTGVET